MLKLQFEDNPSKSLWLVGDRLTLGADAENWIVISGAGVQPFHAHLEVNNDDVELVCSGICYVNNVPVGDRQPLTPGDRLRLGAQVMVIVDPKQQVKTVDTDGALLTATPVETIPDNGWSLHSSHAQLKDQPLVVVDAAVLGRGSDCDLVVPYKLLSRKHARFLVDGDHLLVEDLNSGNGTFVNDQRVTKARLKPGDRISFARLSFTVQGPLVQEKDDLNKTKIRPRVTNAMLAALSKQSDSVASTSNYAEVSPSLLDIEPYDPEPLDDNPRRRIGLVVLLLVMAALVIGFVMRK